MNKCAICGKPAYYRHLVGYPNNSWYCNNHKEQGFDLECDKLEDIEEDN